MSGDPLASPDGSQHGDQAQQGPLPGFSNTHTGYSPFIQQPPTLPGNAQGNAGRPASGFNMPGIYTTTGNDAAYQDASNMVAQVHSRPLIIKVHANEVWTAEPNSLYDFTFACSTKI